MGSAQGSPERAFNYLEAIMGYHQQVSQANMLFFRCAVHCQDPAQVEAYRQELENLLTSAVESIGRIPDYEGDASLRTESITILNSQLESCRKDYLELNQNYAGVNSTADAIEEYYRLLEAAERKQARETERFERAYRGFAGKHDIQLVENDMESEVEFANRVNGYYRALNMPTLPLQSAMARAMEAVEAENHKALEDARFALAAEIKKANYKVNQLGPFEEDDNFRQATLSYIEIMDQAAKTHFPAMVQYLRFQKNEDVEGYNAAIDFLNSSLNPAIQQLNLAQETFLKNHVPEPPKGTKRI
jgi:chromosome segregation ATPase